MKRNATARITSQRNERIKAVQRLAKKRERAHRGLFVIEGLPEIERAIEGGLEIVEAFDCPSICNDPRKERILSTLSQSGIPVSTLSHSVFSKLAYREDTGGLIVVARTMNTSIEKLPTGDRPIYVVAESVEKPGNLGAILRSADGSGATGVILADPSSDIYNPNIIRASLGTVFTVPIAVAPAREAMDWLKKNQVRIISTSPIAQKLYTELDLTIPVAIVVGSEDEGLSKAWVEHSDCMVKIPMLGRADSLNVSAAATIILYEALRQRVQSGIINVGPPRRKESTR